MKAYLNKIYDGRMSHKLGTVTIFRLLGLRLGFGLGLRLGLRSEYSLDMRLLFQGETCFALVLWLQFLPSL